MKISAKQDVQAPAEFVFAALSDFETWERNAMRRGADVQRIDGLQRPGVGMAWHVAFGYRGKTRNLDLRLTTFEPPAQFEMTVASPAISAIFSINIVEMSSRRSRIQVVTNITPRTLTARLFIQSLRLARARVEKRYNARISQIVADIEARYQAQIQTQAN